MTFSGHNLITLKHFISQITILVIPELSSICRIHTCVTVVIVLTNRMSDHILETRCGVYKFRNSVIECRYTVFIVSNIRIEVQHKRFYAQDGGIQSYFNASVDQ